ncbi:sigma-70 family RNA polymerase sigma factor [Hymenobacter sp. BRD128]|uniref:sigma-70 family RNA polymerase sigma factor n=1 Tax=Hymenobacter sp. BRD128 TaxID=2675878 RepID=UPI00156346D9|nr:sigma-70 family RNA polymerase sigma factor [Hymenobacter sp. BRD128]QKG58249.1 sigma-70 family RNA polymerase sigma factor [Hymenobacter sp. BRD128]
MSSTAFHIYAAYPDAALLDAMRANEEGAFVEIYRRYCYRLFTVACRKLKSQEAAEELIQDLFADLWSRRAGLQVERLESYLFSMVRYRVINYVKSQKLKAGYDLYCRLSQSTMDPGTEDALALNDLTAALMAGVRKLPEKTREIFQLSRLEQCTVPEISTRVNLSEKAVEYHLTKSLKLLRSYLRDFLLLLLPLFIFLRQINPQIINGLPFTKQHISYYLKKKLSPV